MSKIFPKSGLIVSCNKKFNWRNLRTYLSLLIRFGTQSRWSHTGYVIVLYDTIFVIDSDLGKGRNGVGITQWSHWVKDKNEVQLYDPKIKDTKFHDKRALKQCGVSKYDLHGFKHQINKALTGHYNGETDLIQAAKRFYCSEFVAWVYNVWNWQGRTPKNMFEKRKAFFPESIDLYEGKGKELEWTF